MVIVFPCCEQLALKPSSHNLTGLGALKLIIRWATRDWGINLYPLHKGNYFHTNNRDTDFIRRVWKKTCKNKSVCVLSGYKTVVTFAPTDRNASPKVTLQHRISQTVKELTQEHLILRPSLKNTIWSEVCSSYSTWPRKEWSNQLFHGIV